MMKILYAIQGTGNGHLSRAIDIVPILQSTADVDVLVSGINSDLQLPFKVDYQLYGLSFINGKKGGVSISKTASKIKFHKFLLDVMKLPVNNYDLIISDFEPVSAWACLLKGKKCIGLSHQNAVLHELAPRPSRKDLFGQMVLNFYAPVSEKYGFHFDALDENMFTPVIRKGIREANPTNNGHYTVYLPAYSDEEIQNILSPFSHIQWEVFSKQSKVAYQFGNINFKPISLTEFTESFVHCEGILTTAGFETPAEALFMGKKLCVVPTKNQYEQECNAAFLESMGITVISSLRRQKSLLANWVDNGQIIQKNYLDKTRSILFDIIEKQQLEEEFNPYYWIFRQRFMRPIQLKMISLKENRLVPFNTLERKGHKFANLFRQFFDLW